MKQTRALALLVAAAWMAPMLLVQAEVALACHTLRTTTTLTALDCPSRCGAAGPCVFYAPKDPCGETEASGECFIDEAYGAPGTTSSCTVTYQCLSGLVGETNDWPRVLTMAPASVESVVVSNVDLQNALATTDFSKRSWSAVAFNNANLKEVPAGLAKLPLQYVELSKNFISNISDASPFKNVSTLNLAFNDLKDLTITLPAIVTLNLTGNPLAKIPDAVFSMKTLKSLSLRQCNLTNVALTEAQFAFLQQVQTLDADLVTTTCPNGTISQTFPSGAGSVCIRGSAPAFAPTQEAAKSSSNSTAIIVGIVTAVVVVALLAFFLCRRKKRSPRNYAGDSQKDNEATPDVQCYPNLLAYRIEYSAIKTTQLLSRSTYWDTWLGRFDSANVIVKRLPSNSISAHRTKVFADHVEMMAPLDHPNIVRVVGVAWTDESMIQAVTEYMDSGDLRSLLDSDRALLLSWANLKSRIAIDIAGALAYLHTRTPKIVYCELTSRKIFIAADGGAKLSVLGIKPKFVMNQTMAGGGAGFRWTAPEVIAGERYNESADMYSFGAILSELDTTEIPFHDAVDDQGDAMPGILVAQLVVNGLVKPSFSNLGPKSLVKLAQDCLSADPTQRPSALHISNELRRILKGGDDDATGFLTASAQDTYGASSVWMDPELQQLRLDVLGISAFDDLAISPTDAANSTQTYAGTYRGEQVTIKRLNETAKTIERAVAFVTNCKMVHGLQHPNIVPLIGLAWHKAIDIQVVTPYARRGNLRSYLDSSEAASVTWGDFKCQVAIDVTSALACLHAHNRSAGLGGVTSYHVMLRGEEDTVAQLDVLQLPCRDVAIAQDRVPSPLRWLAPEVVRGDVVSSATADLYALGVLLTELDTTKRPFYDAVNPNGAPMDDMLIAMRVSKNELRPQVSSECPEAIGELVHKCLAQDPLLRPRADQVVYQLRAVLKDL